MSAELKVLSFKSAAIFKRWLAAECDSCPGISLRIFKKQSGQETVTYQEALEEALCFGWIDGQKKAYDEKSFLQKFTPRRAKSLWSQRNISLVESLIKQRRMRSPGLAAVNSAMADGRWERAYASSKDMALPKDFLSALKKNKIAQAAFQTLSKSSVFSIYMKLHTAKKPETRSRRMEIIIRELGRRA